MPTDSEKSLTPIRIGIECESIEEDTYGVARVVRKLLEQLAGRPQLATTHRFHLYFKKRIPNLPFLDSPLFVKVVTTPRGTPASFNLHYHVWTVLRAYRDGVGVMFFPNYQLPLLWFKKSVVMLTEDIWHEMRNPALPFRYRLSYTLFANWAARAATRVMAISRSSGDAVSRLFGIAPGRIAVNELAVDPPAPTHGITRTTPYVLFVGQPFPRRHLLQTQEAFAHIAGRFPGMEFVVVGPGNPVSDRELTLLYKNARVLTYISSCEGFGLPPLEALSYGTPAVLADTPVGHEIFGEHAWYVSDPDNVDEIARVLSQALTDTDKRERIRAAAPAIIARYTWSRHADRFLSLIDELAHT